ncbi:MAG: DUF4174 domain-containing protein [Bacteroidota bacterium]
MKTIIFILLVLFSLEAFAQDIKEYQWKNRLLVLVSNASNSSEVNQQHKIFEQKEPQLLERDILLLKRQPESQDLAHFSLKTNFEGVLLIGKDGGIKLKKPFIVEPQVIFDLVDSMPMRKAEIRSKY